MSLNRSSLIPAAVLLLAVACSSDGSDAGQADGGASGSDPTGAAGTSTAGMNSGGSSGNAAGGTTNNGGTGTDGGTAGVSTSGAGGDAPSAGAGGTAGQSTGGSAGLGGSGGVGGASDGDPPPPRPINVIPEESFDDSFNGQPMSVTKNQPIMGKLVLVLGGIGNGPGGGGIESFIKKFGFHLFAPRTQTNVNSAPDDYKHTIDTMPDDAEANRQVGDARMELWDGVDRVNWVSVNTGESILEETIAAIHYGEDADPGGDWGYFLNADGTLRTTDVWVVGYSWGSQSWAMISSYVRFGRVITTSGPVAEGFPNGTWMTHPSATPNDRKYLLAGLDNPYPDPGDTGVMNIFANCMKAGWLGDPVNVLPNGMGTYTSDQHLFAMIGKNDNSPGGHTVFCNDNPMNGWIPLCKYVFNVQ